MSKVDLARIYTDAEEGLVAAQKSHQAPKPSSGTVYADQSTLRQVYLVLDRQTGQNQGLVGLSSHFRPVCTGERQAGFRFPTFWCSLLELLHAGYT